VSTAFPDARELRGSMTVTTNAEKRRKLHISPAMAAILLLAALAPIAASGCFATGALWAYGRVSEKFPEVREVWVSPDGAACLIYSTVMFRSDLGGDFPSPFSHHWTRIKELDAFERCMMIPADVLASASTEEGTSSLSAGSTAPFVLPKNIRASSYDETFVQAAIQDWHSIPIVRAQSWSEWYDMMTGRAEKREAAKLEASAQRQRLLEEARASGKAFDFAVDQKVEIPLPAQRRVALAIPNRESGFKWWTYPIRVVLTPPALAVDTVYVVVWVPIAAVAFAVAR
jgi:hypothetical protein